VARNAWFGVALLALTAGFGGELAAQSQVAQVAHVRVQIDSLSRRRTTQIDRANSAVNGAAVTDSTSRTSLAATAARPAAPAKDSLAKDSLALDAEATVADSIRRAREIDVLRETFAYAGGTRDPYASLINSNKIGPELADLDLVGVYLDLRTPSNNVIVMREKGADGKRHKMRVGDQLGRSRLVQIRARDAVFMIADFGYERQETLSLRKQEVETP
jgi:hypothetical protein